MGGANRLVLLAVRNATRQRLRSTLTVVTLSLGGLFFMSALGVKQSLVRTVDRFYAASRSDLAINLAAEAPAEIVARAARSVQGVAAVEGWRVAEGALGGQDPARRRNRLTVVGLPPGSAMTAFEVAAGSAQPTHPAGAVLNSALHDRLGRPAVGDAVAIAVEGKQEHLQVVGVVREPFAQPVAYVGLRFFDARGSQGLVNAVRVTLVDPAGAEAVKDRLEMALEAEGVRLVRAQTKAESRSSFDQHMVMIYVFLIIVSAILGAVGALGLFSTVSLNVGERRRELAVLRAIGSTPARVAGLVMLEAVAVGLVGWIIAALMVVPVTALAGNLILRAVLGSGAELAVGLDATGPLLWLAIAVAGSALAAAGPAWRASRTVVRGALAYE